jgi:hypothetical protein
LIVRRQNVMQREGVLGIWFWGLDIF